MLCHKPYPDLRPCSLRSLRTLALHVVAPQYANYHFTHILGHIYLTYDDHFQVRPQIGADRNEMNRLHLDEQARAWYDRK